MTTDYGQTSPERESEPITADVTGSMQRGLRYDPAITGPAVSVDERGVSLDPDGIPNPWRGIAEEQRAAKARPEPGSWVTVTIPRAIVSDRHVQDKHLWLFVGSDNDALYIPFVAIDAGSVEVKPASHRPPLDRIAIPNPDDVVAQPGALTRVDILVGQLRFLDADGLAALADAIRERQDEVTA